MRALESAFELASVRARRLRRAAPLAGPDPAPARQRPAPHPGRLRDRPRPPRQGPERRARTVRRGGSARLDFSSHLDLMIERGWIAASLSSGPAASAPATCCYGHAGRGRAAAAAASTISGEFRTARGRAAGRELRRHDGRLARGGGGTAPPRLTGSAGHAWRRRRAKALDSYTTDLTADGAGRQARPGARPRRRDPAAGRHPDAPAPEQPDPRRRGRASARRPWSRASRSAIAKGDVPPPLKDVRLLRARPRPACRPAPRSRASSRTG